MRIELLDNVVETDGLDITKTYEVLRTETVRDDLYYMVQNDAGIEVAVHELVAKEM